MVDDATKRTPQSPEVQPAGVRDALDQALVSHEGRPESEGAPQTSQHMGSTETEVSPVTSPMHGPDNVIGPAAGGDSADDANEWFDPIDEMTPG